MCPNDWMTPFDRLIGDVAWWIACHVPKWTRYVRKRIDCTLNFCFGQGLYNRMDKIRRWADYRHEPKENDPLLRLR